MANTYTTKLGLAKPANGDINWHIPINENWDKIDTELDKALKISGTIIDADKNWNGKKITNIASIQTDIFQSTNIRPYICVASNETRYESLASADTRIDDCDNYTATLKTYRIPTGAPYYGAGYYQMSVRVTAKFALSCIDAVAATGVVDFWLRVDGVIKKSVRLANDVTQDVSWDVQVNPLSEIQIGVTRASMLQGKFGTASVSDFRIRASDTFAEPQGW